LKEGIGEGKGRKRDDMRSKMGGKDEKRRGKINSVRSSFQIIWDWVACRE